MMAIATGSSTIVTPCWPSDDDCFLVCSDDVSLPAANVCILVISFLHTVNGIAQNLLMLSGRTKTRGAENSMLVGKITSVIQMAIKISSGIRQSAHSFSEARNRLAESSFPITCWNRLFA